MGLWYLRLSFNDFRVYGSDTIYSMARYNAEVRHVYSLYTILLDNRHLSHFVVVPRPFLSNLLFNGEIKRLSLLWQKKFREKI